MPDIYTVSSPEFGTAQGHQLEIPPTDPAHYITGVYALNIPAPEGTTGDWHDVFHWREGIDRPGRVLVGGSEELDTNPIYGTLGIYEGKARLESLGLELPPGTEQVYVANHSRAILDLLYRSLTRFQAVFNLTGATEDWLDTPEQRDYLLTQAERLTPTLAERGRAALGDWIKHEREGSALTA